MSDLLLRIFFHGLIAFVPQKDDAPYLTALLVNATDVPMNASGCVTAHQANVIFLYDKTACLDNGCTTDPEDRCVCPLQHTKIISLSSIPAQDYQGPALTDPPPHDLPTEHTDEGNKFSYLINLNRWGLHLDKKFLGSPPPPELVGRFDFHFTRLHACSLARVVSGGTELIRSFRLGPLGSQPSGPQQDQMQAVAQGLAADLTIHTPTVTLSISDVDNGTVRSFTLKTFSDCGKSGPCLLLWIDNERPADVTEATCNDGVGRDFAFLAGLAQKNEPDGGWDARTLPKADLNTGAKTVDPNALVTDDVCDHIMHGPTSRPICAMAVIN